MTDKDEMFRFRYWESTGRCFDDLFSYADFEKMCVETGSHGGPMCKSSERHPDENQLGYMFRPGSDGKYAWEGFKDLSWKPLVGGRTEVIKAYADIQKRD